MDASRISMGNRVGVDSAKSVYQVSENIRAGQGRLNYKAYYPEALRRCALIMDTLPPATSTDPIVLSPIIKNTAKKLKFWDHNNRKTAILRIMIGTHIFAASGAHFKSRFN